MTNITQLSTPVSGIFKSSATVLSRSNSNTSYRRFKSTEAPSNDNNNNAKNNIDFSSPAKFIRLNTFVSKSACGETDESEMNNETLV